MFHLTADRDCALAEMDGEDAKGQDVRVHVVAPKIRGLSMVMFTSTRCKVCTKVVPTFKALASKVRGVTFAFYSMDVRKNLDVCKELNFPEEIPYLMLYNNGHPVMAYNGSNNLDEMLHFIGSIQQNSREQKQLAIPSRFEHPQERITAAQMAAQTRSRAIEAARQKLDRRGGGGGPGGGGHAGRGGGGGGARDEGRYEGGAEGIPQGHMRPRARIAVYESGIPLYGFEDAMSYVQVLEATD